MSMSDNLHRNRWKNILTVLTIIALIGLTYAVRDQLADTLRDLQRVNLFWVLMVVPLEILKHYAQGGFYKDLFKILGQKFRLRSMFRLSLELNFVNTLFPSGGVSGFSYLSLRMKGEGVSTAKSTLVQTLRFILMFISFQI